MGCSSWAGLSGRHEVQLGYLVHAAVLSCRYIIQLVSCLQEKGDTAVVLLSRQAVQMWPAAEPAVGGMQQVQQQQRCRYSNCFGCSLCCSTGGHILLKSCAGA